MVLSLSFISSPFFARLPVYESVSLVGLIMQSDVNGATCMSAGVIV